MTVTRCKSRQFNFSLRAKINHIECKDACLIEYLFLFPSIHKLSKAIMNYHSYSRIQSETFFIAFVVMR